MNLVIMMGRLTKDPEIRYAQKGTESMAIASFSLAVDRKFKRDNEPEADFFNCSAFGKTAEFVEKYLKKGTKILLNGRVQNDNYEKDGVKHYSTKIMVDQLEFAEGKKSETEPKTEAKPSENDFIDVSGLESELPFN